MEYRPEIWEIILEAHMMNAAIDPKASPPLASSMTHPWDLSPAEAVALQHTLAQKVREEPLEDPVKTIGGVDVSIRKGRAQAAVVVVRLPDLTVIDEAIWQDEVRFPYVPGLLSFREIPLILPAIEQLTVMPQVFMVDGQGRAHPRRFGLACHLGLLLDKPAFGVAKKLLVGAYETLGAEKGSRVPLLDKKTGAVIGTALRTRSYVQPVYISVGHRITLREAEALTLVCAPRYRIPVPTRQAHLLSRKIVAV